MDPEAEDFEYQLKLEQEEQWKRDNGYIYTDPNDGTMYEWDPEKKAWFPKVDENFIASYQASYGVTTDENTADGQTDPQPSAAAATSASASSGTPGTSAGVGEDTTPGGKDGAKGEGEVKKLDEQPQMLYRYQKMQMKRKAEQKSWFEVDPTKNTNVYVSGLPTDITLEEFQEVMAKWGIIMLEEETEKPKIKLYMDEEGRPKGDGRCCYLKRESVDLALQLLDESEIRGHKIHVEVATFTLKGDYKPDMRKKKKPNKKKKGNVQDKLLDWRPEKKFQQRKRNEQVIILKHVFHPSEFEEDAMLINDIKDDVKDECSTYGEVKKVLIFDRHPDGVVSVKFKDVENADKCIQSLNGRWFAKRKLEVTHWDGKTDYKIEETDKEREERLKKWEDFLQDDEEEEDKKKKDGMKKEDDRMETSEETKNVGADEGMAKEEVDTEKKGSDNGVMMEGTDEEEEEKEEGNS
ncbi:HIV Tat-specific factor 1 homolog [Strongylocentrotus purpuratus]|uniref:17S U2 SnRNP complex component HTATSF1 n=1 Tax=Strongylocentrotus purpuratus TaxID=7668 RepID=A0A7M7HLN3_STRPU|nr:HIV Tat-specific factor 1 homolog [Strongylocentrotus purpuratus]|eukprot:XP_011664874.1 PREDICTED: HIV Tat-specific factor 1 homolog [Strongylocentrotus purpuratus]